jgi:hypothetical protein
MRRSFYLILVGLGLVLSGCIRERTNGDTLVLHMRWWTLLWGFAVPLAVAYIMFSKHPSVWVNGRWRPWWTLHGWDAKEIGYAVGFLLVLPLMSVAFLFDRLEVTPDHIREFSLSPFRGTRQIAIRDIQRIELRPPDQDKGFLGSIGKRKKKSPPEMRLILSDGREEAFGGFLVRQAQSTILERARQAGAIVTNAPPVARPAGMGPKPPALPQNRGGGGRAARNPPDFDPFENAQPKFVPVEPKR